MRQRIENRLDITISGDSNLDLTTATDLEFYVRQGALFYQKTPVVQNATSITVTISKDEADVLKTKPASCQLAFTDANGNKRATDILYVNVAALLKESGYDS